jgi:translation elongation factor EF-Tu-like GTPase
MKKKKARAKAKPKAAKKRPARKPLKAKAKAKKSSPKRSKKTAAPKSAARPGIIAPVNSVLLGFVDDYFAKVGVIAFTLKAAVAVGQRLQVLGYTTHLEQTVDSMQIDHVSVAEARAGDGVGIKVMGRARAGDHVYLLK